MSSLLSRPTMPEECKGPTVEKRFRVEITALVKPGEEPTPAQVQEFFNTVFSEGFKSLWQAATCDDVIPLP